VKNQHVLVHASEKEITLLYKVVEGCLLIFECARLMIKASVIRVLEFMLLKWQSSLNRSSRSLEFSLNNFLTLQLAKRKVEELESAEENFHGKQLKFNDDEIEV
jgi:hypothetical protein